MRVVALESPGTFSADLRAPQRVVRVRRAASIDAQSLPAARRRAHNALAVLAARADRLAAERGAALALGSLIERMGGAAGSSVRGDYLSVRA